MIHQHLLQRMESSPDFESEDGQSRFWMLGPYNDGAAWVGRFTGTSPWTRHPDTDAYMQVLEGEVELAVWTADGPRAQALRPGELCIVPRDTWYQQHAAQEALQYGITAGTTEHAETDPPPA